MKIFRFVFAMIIVGYSTVLTYAGFFTDLLGGNSNKIPYDDKGLGLDEGVNALKNIQDIETQRTLSEYVQDVVEFLLGFLTLIAVIFIIYAGFNMMIGNGDEEKAKKTKSIIIYVIIGIVVIWLAYSIAIFVFDVLKAS